jgi:hypothetical protein
LLCLSPRNINVIIDDDWVVDVGNGVYRCVKIECRSGISTVLFNISIKLIFE